MEQSEGGLILEIMHVPSSPEDGLPFVIPEVREAIHTPEIIAFPWTSPGNTCL